MLNENSTPTTQQVIHPATHMGPLTLSVADLARSVDFYTNVLGMKVLNQSEGKATVGAGSTPLIYLQEQSGAHRQPQYSTGLYHAAILVPSRADLGRVIISLAQHSYPIGGFGDHYVSEAMYLDDPDGNGLEIYRDRPRDEWQWNGSQVVMGTDPVDVDGVIKSVDNPEAPYAGMPDGTVLGHMHLRVGDIPQAEAFYVGVLGFELIFKMPSALFVSAGRYHHHIGMNIWHSRKAPPAPADSVGLREYTIILPDEAARDQVLARLDTAGVAFERQGADVLLDDPWSNRIRLVTE